MNSVHCGIRFCAGLLIIFQLASCAALKSVETLPASRSAEQLSQWQIRGKMSLRLERRSGSGYFQWSWRGNTWSMQISGPWGAGAVRLKGDAWGVSLEDGGQTLVADSPEALLKQHFGWDLPVSNLSYWVRGLPVPGQIANAMRNANDSLSQLNQAGWHIEFTAYKRYADYLLPGKIVLHKGTTRFTVIASQWSALLGT